MNNERCLDMQRRAKDRIPGMTQLLSKRPDMFSYGTWPTYYSRAEGARVWDLDGNEYLDMSIAGIGANVLGYADPDVDRAVVDIIRLGTSSSLNCPEEVELAELLCDIHPWADMARFTRAGGEAMAMAVRIARAATGRDKVAFCGYHGWHDWYLAANVGTENALGEHLLPGLDPAGVPSGLSGTALPFRYNHPEELKAIASENSLAAIIMEPIRNTPPDPDFLSTVRSIADAQGAVMIFDEISAGFRLCSSGAHMELSETRPDMAVFSKALGNGYPIAAAIGKKEFMQAAQDTFISSTNWTERVGPVAALATIRKHIQLDVSSRLKTLGEAVQEGWSRLSKRHGLTLEISGIPPLSHFSFPGKDALTQKALFVQLMLEKGILASNLYYSMYAHSDDDIAEYLQACDEVFEVMGSTDDPAALLKGSPSAAGFKRIA